MVGLTVRQTRFVDIIARDEEISATRAAISAGYSENTAAQSGSDNLRKDYIQAAISKRRKELAAEAGITPGLVLRELLAIATADRSKLTQTRRGSCRYCYGIDHQYQWTRGEYERALDEALALDKPAPELRGGFGYLKTREPLPECPECSGEGVVRVWVADVRDLDEETAKLFDSVKQTKDGIEIKMPERIAALDRLGRYLGMFTDKTELSGPAGGPLAVAVAATSIRPEDLTDEQLVAIIAAGAANLGVPVGVQPAGALPANTIEGTCEPV